MSTLRLPWPWQSCSAFLGPSGWSVSWCCPTWCSPRLPSSRSHSCASAPQLTTSPIHDHTWQLTSFVVCGELENRVIQVDDVDDPTHRVFEIRGTGSDDFLRPTERLVRFRCSGIERVKQGGRYVMAAGQFHYTQVAEGITTATVVLAERKTTSPERSLGPFDMPRHRMTRADCSPTELAEAAHAVLVALVGVNMTKEKLR